MEKVKLTIAPRRLGGRTRRFQFSREQAAPPKPKRPPPMNRRKPLIRNPLLLICGRWDLNPHGLPHQDPKSYVSANFTTSARNRLSVVFGLLPTLSRATATSLLGQLPGGPGGQFFAKDLGVVANIHRKGRMEEEIPDRGGPGIRRSQPPDLGQ